MLPDITTVMISCEERQSERQKTLEQFDNLGLKVKVFTNICTILDPASPAKNMRNSIAALTYAESTGKDVLFVEDDIDLKPELLDWLNLLQKTDLYFADFCVMWQHVHPKAVMPYLKSYSMPPCLGIWQEAERWWGTQAIYLNKDAVRIIMAQKDHFKVKDWAFDIYLRFLMLRLAWPVYACFPNPVQHRSPLSMVRATNLEKGQIVPREPRHSITFDIEPNKPIADAVWLKAEVKAWHSPIQKQT